MDIASRIVCISNFTSFNITFLSAIAYYTNRVTFTFVTRTYTESDFYISHVIPWISNLLLAQSKT